MTRPIARMTRPAAGVVVLVTIALTAWFVSGIFTTLADRREQEVVSLPALAYTILGGEVQASMDPAGRPLILLFFQTTCAFCDQEIRAFVERESLLGDAAVLLISNEPPELLRAFHESVALDGAARFTVVHDEHAVIGRRFGVRRIPALFVYDSHGNLLKTFRGLTPVETVAAVLEDHSSIPVLMHPEKSRKSAD